MNPDLRLIETVWMVGSSPDDLELCVVHDTGPAPPVWRVMLGVGPTTVSLAAFKTRLQAESARDALMLTLQDDFNHAPAWCNTCDGYVHEDCVCDAPGPEVGA